MTSEWFRGTSPGGFRPRLLLILSGFFFCANLTAQNSESRKVRARITDMAAGTPLPGAAAEVLRLRDSSRVTAALSDAGGRVELNLPPGRYRLSLRFLGYDTVARFLRVEDADLDLGDIGLTEAARNLPGVQVEGKIPPVRQNGDTTQFNAAGFKTNADATTEDLIRKMPGVSVSDGKISVQGEEVRKVLVDNKPFFGDDPGTALKNLPAEVVDRIQVFDQGSDQSRFTGFNDGNTQKTINIVTRAGMRNGRFGRAYAGAGTDERYKGGFSLNQFSGARRITLLGQSNNINEQNFTMADLSGIMGGGGGAGGGRGGRGGGGGMGQGFGMGRGGGFNGPAQDFLVSPRSGIVQTYAAGINYSDNWGKKTEVSGNYFYNQSANRVERNTLRSFVQNRDSGQVYREMASTLTTNRNHRFNLRMETRFDTNNSLVYTPRITIQDIQQEGNTDGNNRFGSRDLSRTRIESGLSQQVYSMNHDILLRHRFRRRGRTISLNSNLGLNGSSGEGSQLARNEFFGKGGFPDTADQANRIRKSGWSVQNTLTYTEPLGPKAQLTATLGWNHARTDNDRRTTRRGRAGLPDRLDSLLSNVFISRNPSQSAGLGYAWTGEKSNLNAGLTYQHSRLDNDRTFPLPGSVNRAFQNLLPNLMWRYSFSENRNFRLIYRTSAGAPSIEQLQDVVNNTNPLQLSSGNSGLRQDFQQNLFFRYMSSNPARSSSFFGMIAGSAIRHYIGNSTTIARTDTVLNGVRLGRGGQFTQPVNLQGFYSFRTFVMYSRPLAFIKSNINLNANANYTRTPGVVNGRTNFARSPVLGAGLNLSSNISKSVDFNLGYNISYTSVSNTLNKNSDNAFFNHGLSARANFVIAGRWVLNTEYTQTLIRGLSAGFDTDFILLNAGMGYKFLKRRQAEVRLSAFDLLNQNTNVSRTITEAFTEDLRTNNLTRYFLLTFTYTLRAFRGEGGQDGRPAFPPGGIPRPGVGPPGVTPIPPGHP